VGGGERGSAEALDPRRWRDARASAQVTSARLRVPAEKNEARNFANRSPLLWEIVGAP
jgi:hypothetical protein